MARKVIFTTNLNDPVKSTIKASIPYKSIIPLATPTNLELVPTGGSTTVTVIKWDVVEHATHYNVFYNGTLFRVVDTNTITILTELQGNISVQAFNKVAQSEISDDLYVFTVPNKPLGMTVSYTYTDGEGYYFVVNFTDNSYLETEYRVIYQVDDGSITTLKVSASEGAGQVLVSRFATYDIQDKISIRVIAANTLGTNEIGEQVLLYKTESPLWYYDTSRSRVKFIASNRIPNVTQYEIKYKYPGEDWQTSIINIDPPLQPGDEQEHYINLPESVNVQMQVCSISNGVRHLPSKTQMVGKNYDTLLVPPRDFTSEWLSDGVLQLSWKDAGSKSYELELDIDGKIQTKLIKSLDISDLEYDNTFHLWTYVHDFTVAGVSSNASFRVRSLIPVDDEVFYSDYTEMLSVVYVVLEKRPPHYFSKSVAEDGSTVFTWEPMAYVDKYMFYFEVDGSGLVHEVLLSENTYTLALSRIDTGIYDNYIRCWMKVSFIGGYISEETEHILFKPYKKVNTSIMSISRHVEDSTIMDTMILESTHSEVGLHTLTSNPTKLEVVLESLSTTELVQSSYPYELQSYVVNAEFPGAITGLISNNLLKSTSTLESLTYLPNVSEIPVETVIRTVKSTEYSLYTEINLVRIVCIGDSLTSGHPGYYAETLTGDPQHCYEYWLNRRLKGAYEIINKGYGSDTTDQILARFSTDVIPYNPQYCIMQGGTNDLYWSQANSNGDVAALERDMQVVRNNIIEMVRVCWANNIYPIVGTLLVRTGATGIYKDALYAHNEWLINWCTENNTEERPVAYWDWFNAGKDAVPPTPLEDLTNPGAMNPIYDGDALFDEYGNIVKQGRGIHLNKEGYKILAESLNLAIFKTYDSGFKLYKDADCLIEEDYNNDDKLNPYYTMKIDNIRRGKKKTIVRYVKNIGQKQALFALYFSNEYNITAWFLDEEGVKVPISSALASPSTVTRVVIEMILNNEDTSATLNLNLAGRELTLK